MHRQSSVGLHAMKGALGIVGHLGQLPLRIQISPCPLRSTALLHDGHVVRLNLPISAVVLSAGH